MKPPKTRSKGKSETGKNKEEDLRTTARSSSKGTLEHFYKRQGSGNQSRKRSSCSPAGDRRNKDPKLYKSPEEEKKEKEVKLNSSLKKH